MSSLVADADPARRLDIAMMVWVLRSPERVVLVDAGFYRDKFMPQWKPVDYVRPSDALKAGLGIEADQVTDIIVTHVHWDHLDGADLFPRAKVWLQREEYDYYVGPGGEVRNRAIDPEDAAMVARIAADGRLMLADGDDREILPGVRVYTGGRHTFASQYVGVRTRVGDGHPCLGQRVSLRKPRARRRDCRDDRPRRQRRRASSDAASSPRTRSSWCPDTIRPYSIGSPW